MLLLRSKIPTYFFNGCLLQDVMLDQEPFVVSLSEAQNMLKVTCTAKLIFIDKTDFVKASRGRDDLFIENVSQTPALLCLQVSPRSKEAAH